MSQPLTGTNSNVNAGTGPDRESKTGSRRWVKVLGIVVVVLVLLFLVLQIVGVGGSHGPGRHTSSGDTSLSGGTESGMQ